MARTSSTGTMSSNEDTDEKDVSTFESPSKTMFMSTEAIS